MLYQVKLLDGSVRWVFKTELGTIKGNYDRLTEIPVTSSDQIFTIKKTDGSTIQTDLAGLLNERKLGTIDDIPVPPTTPPPAADPCAPLAPLGCTDLEQQAQNQSLALILNDMASLDVSTLQYPVQIHLVRLCDGSTAYILDQFLGDLEGSHLTIGSITVTSPDQLFNVTAVQPEPIFAMAFNHEANGNISRAEWQTTFHRSQFYDYAYDPLNRLLSAQYGEVVPSYAVVGGAFQKFVYQINNNYNENNLTYDGDGNIKTLQRMGLSDANNCASKVQIDNLLYTLIPGTPRLQKVADSAPAANRAKGFNPGASPGSDYVYDQNGNLITDPYKGLTIQYYFLNLPKQITKGGSSITIRYDVTGRKWSQAGPEGIREYVGGVEYLDQEIQSVQHGEGRLVPAYSGTSIASIRAEYWRQDHLGNTRVAFSDFNLDGVIATKDDPNTTENDIEITQENHYYPFGLNHEGPWYQTVAPKNKYLFNGIEEIDDFQINVFLADFRFGASDIGRWMQIDPLSEIIPGLSSYHFSFNNPILFSDPMGIMGTLDNPGFSVDTWNVIQNAWDATPEGTNASYSVVFNPWGGNEIGRELTGNGPRIYFEGSYSLMGIPDNFLDASGTVATWASAAFTTLGELKYSGGPLGLGIWRGKNGVYYSINPSAGKTRPFYGNQFTGSRNAAKLASRALQKAGKAFGVYNYFAIYQSYQDGKIDKSWAWAEVVSNTIGTFGGLYGVSWTIGWEGGRNITGRNWYRKNVRPIIQDVLGIKRDEFVQFIGSNGWHYTGKN